MALFAVVFPSYSFPITSEHFARVDQTHWVLDVCSLVRQQYWEVKEVRVWDTAGPISTQLHKTIYWCALCQDQPSRHTTAIVSATAPPARTCSLVAWSLGEDRC
jgi:hypothetical protein